MAGASLALASDTTVMSIGGFTGSDPAPTLEQFQAYVAAGDVHYFVVGGGPGGGMFGRAGRAGANGEQAGMAGPGGRGGSSSAISSWVQEHFTSTTVGGRTVYDLTRPTT